MNKSDLADLNNDKINCKIMTIYEGSVIRHVRIVRILQSVKFRTEKKRNSEIKFGLINYKFIVQ